MPVSMYIDKKEMVRLRNNLGEIITGGKKGIKSTGLKLSEKLSTAMINEINRQGLFWSDRLIKSVSHAKETSSKNKVKFTWNIPLYGVWLNKTDRGTYWAPTFVEGNTVTGPYKDNIAILEARRNSFGETKKTMPFIKIEPKFWMDIAFKNMDGQLDKYLNGKTGVDEEIKKVINR